MKKYLISLLILLVAVPVFAQVPPIVSSNDDALPEINDRIRSLAISEQVKSAGKIDMFSHPIDNVEDPTDAQDAATKNYVDTYVGSTNITTVGTITTGTWSATDVAVAAGGTGVSTLTDGGILLGSGTDAITALGVAANGEIPIGDGTTDPVLATITGTASEVDVTNGAGTITIGLVDPLAESKGGTGVTANNCLFDSGNYAGNNTGTRDITVAFNPSYVRIVSDVNYTFDITANYDQYQNGGSQAAFSSGGTLGVLKFTVGNDAASANASGTNYDWVAFK